MNSICHEAEYQRSFLGILRDRHNPHCDSVRLAICNAVIWPRFKLLLFFPLLQSDSPGRLDVSTTSEGR